METPAPTKVPGAWYDEAAVERVVRAFRALRHTKGRWAGRPIELDLWQLEHVIRPIFGWKHPDGTRIRRTAWIEVPRKNTKSTLGSGLALVLLVADGELGAEVYAAAAGKDQAKIVHAAAKEMARRSPALKGKLKLLADVISVPGTGGIFRALSKIADAAHGLNVSGAVIDEIHVHRSRDLIDAIETGTGAREQPLIVFITTADEGDDFSIYAEKHTYTRQVASGVVEDPTHFGAIWAAEEGDDPFAESTWRKTNPGLLSGSVTIEYLAKEANKAKANPAYKPVFCRLHLNLRSRALTRYIDLERWDLTAGMLDLEHDFKGRIAYGGLDLSSTIDLTAAALLSPQDDEGWLLRPLFWLPEERIEELEDKTGVPLTRWATDGYLKVTEGNVVDYAQVRSDFDAEVKRLGVTVAEVAYDPWNATETVLEMAKTYTMVPTRQGYATLSSAVKELDRLVRGSTAERMLLIHGGHPVLRWNADCVEVMQDPAGNLKPAKPDSRKSSKRIDGMAATVNAMTRAMLATPKKKPGAVRSFS